MMVLLYKWVGILYSTVNIVNIGTAEDIAVIILKFELP